MVVSQKKQGGITSLNTPDLFIWNFSSMGVLQAELVLKSCRVWYRDYNYTVYIIIMVKGCIRIVSYS